MWQVRFAARVLSALFAMALSLLPDCSCDNLGRIALSAPQSGGGRQFIDAEQRQRFFHGINAVVKGPPWIPAAAAFDAQTSLCDYDMQLLQSLGVNVIRLGVMWPAVEPVEGVYNDTYLEAVASIVTNAASHGIYTLLDMHQDSLSELFCGEGVPAWALLHMRDVLPLPEPIGPRFNDSDFESDSCGIPGCRWPTRQACAAHSWGSMQFSDACGQGYSELWHTGGSDFERSLLFKWASVLAHVAAYFKNFTSVLGLEIVNEPFSGNVFRDPLLLLPGWADAHVLQAAYNLAVPVIRKSNDDILIFFAGTTWSNLGDGFVQVPGGADYSNRSVLAFHYYEPPQVGLQRSPSPAPSANTRVLACRSRRARSSTFAGSLLWPSSFRCGYHAAPDLPPPANQTTSFNAANAIEHRSFTPFSAARCSRSSARPATTAVLRTTR